MYSDLFDAFGGGNPSSGSSGPSRPPEEPPLISFKAGKMDLELQDNGKYAVTADTRRGQVNLKYNASSQLIWEWYDRREKTVVDTFTLTEPTTLERAETPVAEDRVYYWKHDDQWKMIWLQDKEEDPELIGKVNDILKKPSSQSTTTTTSEAGAQTTATGPAAASSSSSSTNDGTSAAGPGTVRSPDNTSTSSSSTSKQVDALSNILENLGMPQGETHNPTSNPGGTLTLADLQGAMAGLQQQEPSAAGPSLQDVVSPDAITSLLENEETRNRLLQELPEEQRSMEHLEENLRSPQVQQTLRSLTAALLPDDNGSLEGYHSLVANFQLNAAAGQRALQETGNPIQAFLDCVLASVEKEKEENDESKDEEMKE